MSVVQVLLDWTNATFAPLGTWGLFILSFIESSFFPIPPDVMLIPLVLNDPSQAMWYALICTIASVLGGMFGYAIGYVGGYPLLKKFVAQKKIDKVHTLFNKYEGWAIFIAAFTPVPYKVFTIAGGVFYINFTKFIIASIIGRGMRFFLEALLLMYFGEAILAFLENNFGIVTSIAVIVIIISYVYVRKKKNSYATVY